MVVVRTDAKGNVLGYDVVDKPVERLPSIRRSRRSQMNDEDEEPDEDPVDEDGDYEDEDQNRQTRTPQSAVVPVRKKRRDTVPSVRLLE